MEIGFATTKLAKLCSSEKEMARRLGPPAAKRLAQRLTELRAADTLEDMRTLPGARCHELSGNRVGQLAVDLVHPRRLIFEPGENPTPRISDGGIDWTAVTSLVVLEIVDYH